MKTYKEIVEAYKAIFDSENGKTVLEHLISKTKFNKSVADLENVNATFYKAGMHDIIKEILDKVNTSPEDLESMLNRVKENNKHTGEF